MTHANRRGVRRRALLAGAAATALAAPAIAQGAPRVARVCGASRALMAACSSRA